MPTKKTAKPKKERSPEWQAAKEEQHRLKRFAILRAAAKSLAERGYHGTSLSGVAKRLGMTNGALYYYFSSKEEMAYECLLATQEQTRECLEAAETEEKGLEKVEAFVRNIIVASRDNPTWVHPGEPFFLKAAMRKSVREVTRKNHRQLAKFIEEGLKDRSIGLCEPRTTALLILGSLVFLHNWVPNIGGQPPEGVAKMAANFVSKSLKSPLSP